MTEAANDLDDVEEFVRRGRRAAAVRFGLAGLLAVAAAVCVFLYARHLDEVQARSNVHFALPDQLQLVGLIGALVGALLLVFAGVAMLRSRRRS